MLAIRDWKRLVADRTILHQLVRTAGERRDLRRSRRVRACASNQLNNKLKSFSRHHATGSGVCQSRTLCTLREDEGVR
jgi:hypothetical protein